MAEVNVPAPSALSTFFDHIGADLPTIAVAESRAVSRERVLARPSAATALDTHILLGAAITRPCPGQTTTGATASPVPSDVICCRRGADAGAGR